MTQRYNGYNKVNIHSLPSLLLINGHGYGIQLNGVETRVPHLSFMKSWSPGKLQNENLFHSILSNSFSDNPCIYLSRSLWQVHHWIHRRELSPFGSLLSPVWKETVIQTELRQLALRNKEHPQIGRVWKMRVSLLNLVKSPSVLADLCTGLYHAKHQITIVKSPRKYRDPCSKRPFLSD